MLKDVFGRVRGTEPFAPVGVTVSQVQPFGVEDVSGAVLVVEPLMAVGSSVEGVSVDVVFESELFESAGASTEGASVDALEDEPFVSVVSAESADLLSRGCASHFQPPRSPATAVSVAIRISSFSGNFIAAFPPGAFRLGIGIRGPIYEARASMVAPPNSCTNAATIDGSNWVPAQRTSSAIASSSVSRDR